MTTTDAPSARPVLSKNALQALMSAGANREGAVPQHGLTLLTRTELREAGMIGARDGLTVKGVVARMAEADRMMDELFPLN